MPKAYSSLGIGKIVETLIVPEALRSTAPPVGAIGKIVEPAGALWTVAFPLPFIGANGSVQFSRDASMTLHLSYASTALRVVRRKTPRPTHLVVVRLDDQERVDGVRHYGYGIHDVTDYPDLPFLSALGRSHDEALSQDAAEREEAFSRWLWSAEGLIERFYARSEERAKHKALSLCQKKGWYVYAEE